MRYVLRYPDTEKEVNVPRHLFAIVSLVLAIGVAPTGAQGTSGAQLRHFPFPFVDEAVRDPELRAFRDQLQRDLKVSNLTALAEAMVPSLRSDWEGSLPTIAYQAQRALALGGAFTMTRGAVRGRREFCAPYVYAALPNDVPAAIDDEGVPWAIVGDHVPMRAQPQPTARVTAYLSWELVKTGTWYDDPQRHLLWAQVHLPDGRAGWVQEAQIRNATDYHVCFAKIDGRWLMTQFARDQYPARSH
jgi:hypothetical protein